MSTINTQRLRNLMIEAIVLHPKDEAEAVLEFERKLLAEDDAQLIWDMLAAIHDGAVQRVILRLYESVKYAAPAHPATTTHTGRQAGAASPQEDVAQGACDEPNLTSASSSPLADGASGAHTADATQAGSKPAASSASGFPRTVTFTQAARVKKQAKAMGAVKSSPLAKIHAPNGLPYSQLRRSAIESILTDVKTPIRDREILTRLLRRMPPTSRAKDTVENCVSEKEQEEIFNEATAYAAAAVTAA